MHFVYDLINNTGSLKIYLFGIPILYFDLSVSKKFLILSFKKKSYRLSIFMSKEDYIFIQTFMSKFINVIYPFYIDNDISIGYKDSFDLVTLYSIINLLYYKLALNIYDKYVDIIISKNIFYSFTNNNCIINLKSTFLISVSDLIYIFCYSLVRRVQYVKKI